MKLLILGLVALTVVGVFLWLFRKKDLLSYFSSGRWWLTWLSIAVITLTHPPVNSLSLVLRQLLHEYLLKSEADPAVKATVIIGLDLVGTKPRGKVFITGQVRAPGAMELMPGEPVTLSQAILRAGSLGDFADKRHVRLVRKKEGVQARRSPAKVEPEKFSLLRNPFRKKAPAPNDATETIIVDLVEILENGHLDRDPELKVGDLIFVPERLINF